MTAYRSWQERREIIQAMIAEAHPKPVSTFALSEDEKVFFRVRAHRAIDAAARRTSAFKSYYALPVAKPFRNIVFASLAVILTSIAAAVIFTLYSDPARDKTPIFTGGAAIMVAAVGWVVAGSITHRNTIRQNTNNLLYARFSQAIFAEATHRFHRRFGFDPAQRITPADIQALRATGDEEDWRTATAVLYLLNYFEFVAHGVLKGDLDPGIVRDNFRGVISFYHDKCQPYVFDAHQKNNRTYSSLIRLRTHYREP